MTNLLPCPLCQSANVAPGVCYVEFKPNEPAARCVDCGCRATLKAWSVRNAPWQPIETYNPAHELNVLVVDDGIVSEAYYDGESDAWFKAGKSEHDFDFVSSDRLFPTHWMPLPAPPNR